MRMSPPRRDSSVGRVHMKTPFSSITCAHIPQKNARPQNKRDVCCVLRLRAVRVRTRTGLCLRALLCPLMAARRSSSRRALSSSEVTSRRTLVRSAGLRSKRRRGPCGRGTKVAGEGGKRDGSKRRGMVGAQVSVSFPREKPRNAGGKPLIRLALGKVQARTMSSPASAGSAAAGFGCGRPPPT